MSGLPSRPASIGRRHILRGAGRINVTPEYPIRLSGYGNRRTESEGIAQRLWAKALAVGEAQNTALLVTVDNCGLPARLTEEVAQRLNRRTGLPRERFVLCATHTHTGPCLSGLLPNLFSQDIPVGQQATIDRYTRELTDRLEQVALAALADRRPGRLAWNAGAINFARNRRTQDGPADHALPVLQVMDLTGKLRAVWVNYACHCTTLYGEFNRIHGDWAGCAQEYIERNFPGAVALVSIGCGADANPQPRSKLEDAQQHGEMIAAEVQRILASTLQSLPTTLQCRLKKFDLPFAALPTREQWEARAKQSGIVGYHARGNLARLDRGESLPVTLPYSVQTWSFGDQLAMVFLAGEVVVDYSLRLKKEFDPNRLWITAYANDVPCYIPSRRILQEGGYEAEDSLWYYDRPARLAPETENLILEAAHELLPETFRFGGQKTGFPPARLR